MSADWIARAEAGISTYLDRMEADIRRQFPGELPPATQGYLDKARANVIPNIRDWLTDEHCLTYSPNIPGGIQDAIDAENWVDLIDAFLQEITFGTAGIRGRMAFDRESILKMRDEGPAARILKGPATLNDKVLLLKSVGVARFARDRGMTRIIIGYDSRINGSAFAERITRLFLAYGLTVYLFDEACPYPEVTFAIPNLRADIGILISASHNDYRYNGYKLSCGNGSQFSLTDRKTIVEDYINHVKPTDIQLLDWADVNPDTLWFLGGSEPVEGVDYHGLESNLIDMHSRHLTHMKQFILNPDLIRQQAEINPLAIGFCAFHGAGRKAVPRILSETGFPDIQRIAKLDALDGMFPTFNSNPGEEQQPDPGDDRAAEIAVTAFREQYGEDGWKRTDCILGTDPDADRLAAVVHVPQEQRHLFNNRDYTLLPADDAWALLIWYRLQHDIETHGAVQNPEEKFITLSHTTSDVLTKLALKHGLGVMKSWVGFAMLAMCVSEIWQGNDLGERHEGRPDPADPHVHPFNYANWNMTNGTRRFNLANMEQSCGFSILGGPPKDAVSMGEGGHVRDKDGVLAALLLAEVAAYAKANHTDLFRLMDENIFCDPEVGYFLNYYEPDPLDGEYDGIAGYIKKREVIEQMLELEKQARDGSLSLAGQKVRSTAIYWTGKYDKANFAGFPDEGIRFYFDDDKWNYMTFRPSGTSNALRFHLQLHEPDTTPDTLVDIKNTLNTRAFDMISDLREKVGALRDR